jgi:hypothetical protein
MADALTVDAPYPFQPENLSRPQTLRNRQLLNSPKKKKGRLKNGVHHSMINGSMRRLIASGEADNDNLN